VSSFYDDPKGDYKLIIKGHDIDKDQVVGVLESLGYHVTEVHEL